MKRTRQILFSLAVLLLLIPSCKEEPIIDSRGKTMKDLVAPDGFDFDMMKSIQISVQLPATVNYASTNRIIEIWSEGINGRPEKMIKTGSADNTGIYQESFSVPVTAKKIFTNCFAGWRSIILLEAGLKQPGGVFTIDYNVGYGETPPKPRQGVPGGAQNGVKSIRNALKAGIDNVLSNGNFSVDKFDKIDTWSSPIKTNGVWYATDEATNYGSIVSEEGNSFVRINSDQYSVGGFTQLVQATSGQIVTFSGDT
ncbi:MAG: hypothetical protein NTV01_22750, partial [Bacteroidia bacterium]|nr:hypothetical protein [Bacteroidia bacterium]